MGTDDVEQAPQEGQVWRERNPKRAGRKVVVEQVGEGFDGTDKVWIRSLSFDDGTKRQRPGPRTKVRLALWHRTFELVTSCEDLCMEKCIGACGVG